MNYLFFDTETTGVPANYQAPVTDTDNWPRLVRLGLIMHDGEKEITSGSTLIVPEGFTIPAEATEVHGITTEEAIAHGMELRKILTRFDYLIHRADCLVAHNIDFDKMIAGAEFIRLGMHSIIMDKPMICTMKSSVDFCQLPGPYGYKWPTLEELYFKLFGDKLEGAHDALTDITATACCFWELQKLGVYEQESYT